MNYKFYTFSIRSLLILSLIVALVLLLLRSREQLARQSEEMVTLKREIKKQESDYQIAVLQQTLCDHALQQSPESRPFYEAKQSFRRLQEKRGQLITKSVRSAQIVRVPVISEVSRSKARYRVFNPDQEPLILRGRVFDKSGNVIHKHDFFRPTSFSFALNPGVSVIDFEVQEIAGHFDSTSRLELNHRVDVTVQPDQDEARFEPFHWSCWHQSQQRPRATFADVIDQSKLFRTSRKHKRLLSVLQVVNGRSSDRLELSLQSSSATRKGSSR